MVRVRQRKGRSGFQVDIRGMLPDGARYRERVKPPVSTYSAALRWGQQREAAIITNGGNEAKEVRAAVPTLAEFWPRFIEGHAKANQEKPSNIDTRERIFRVHLKPRLGELRLDEITDEKVAQLKGRLTKKKPKTVNNILTVLNKLLKVAVDWRVITGLPCRIRLLKSAKPVVEFYEEEHYERLVAAAKLTDPRTHLAALLGGDAGLRLGEILGLEWTDLDLGRRLLKVQRAVYEGELTLPKGGKPRVVPMTARLCAALQAHRHLRGERVLYQDGGAAADNWWLKWLLDVAERRAGLRQGGRVHILRQTFCSRLAARNVPMLTIKELAGHQSLETTQRYMHLSAAAPREGIQALERGTTRAPEQLAERNSSNDG